MPPPTHTSMSPRRGAELDTGLCSARGQAGWRRGTGAGRGKTGSLPGGRALAPQLWRAWRSGPGSGDVGIAQTWAPEPGGCSGWG